MCESGLHFGQRISSFFPDLTRQMMCIPLGFIGSKDVLQPVWNFYHHFKEKYPQEDYEQGSLLALYEFKKNLN